MSMLDLALPGDTSGRRSNPIHETETEAMPFAVNLDWPQPAARVIWLTLATLLALLVALI